MLIPLCTEASRIYVMPDVYASAEILEARHSLSCVQLDGCASSTFNMSEFYNYSFWKSFKNG